MTNYDTLMAKIDTEVVRWRLEDLLAGRITIQAIYQERYRYKHDVKRCLEADLVLALYRVVK